MVDRLSFRKYVQQIAAFDIAQITKKNDERRKSNMSQRMRMFFHYNTYVDLT